MLNNPRKVLFLPVLTLVDLDRYLSDTVTYSSYECPISIIFCCVLVISLAVVYVP